MTTEEIIKEMRKLATSKKIGEQACICAEAANRLEELKQEIQISRKLEENRNERMLDLDKKIQDPSKKRIVKNVMKPLRSFAREDQNLYVTGFDYDTTPCVLEIRKELLNGGIGDYFVYDLIVLSDGTYVAQIGMSNIILKTWIEKYNCRNALHILGEKGLL